MLTRLDAARKRRNDFAHNLEPIKSGDAGQAIRLATDLISKLVEMRVTAPLGMSFWI